MQAARYDIPQRWYALKAQMLGLPQLADYDRMRRRHDRGRARTAGSEARELVLDSYESFSPELRAPRPPLLRRALDRRADAARASAAGAFCAYTVPRVHPYVLLNFTSKRRDVLTLAHELGHGLHVALAADAGAAAAWARR